MKVAQVKENKIIVSEIDDIKLDGRKGAIVMTLGCGLCGSDIVKFRHKIVHDGAVLGHEIVAEILEINSDTKFKKGDRIVTSHHIHAENAISANTAMFQCVSTSRKQIFFRAGSVKKFLYLKNTCKMLLILYRKICQMKRYHFMNLSGAA